MHHRRHTLSLVCAATLSLSLLACQSDPHEALAHHHLGLAELQVKHADDCPRMAQAMKRYIEDHGPEIKHLSKRAALAERAMPPVEIEAANSRGYTSDSRALLLEAHHAHRACLDYEGMRQVDALALRYF